VFCKGGVLTGNARPKRVVNMSSISDSGSAEIRKGLSEAGVAYLSAPVSGTGTL
jgi:3-hydroxyisobutyrate dehydrogenase